MTLEGSASGDGRRALPPAVPLESLYIKAISKKRRWRGSRLGMQPWDYD